MASLAGQTFEKYEVLNEVGHGGMAVVYRARDSVLEREVAIKVLHAHLADRAESRARLKREAITVAKLRHDNILEIYDYSGEDAEQAYLVTEFIHGETLRAWVERDYVPRPAVAALIVRALADALQAAHVLNIVHRDIKPDNVMIRDDGCLKLMDFGIAQLVDQQKLTMTGQLLGSPAFMAPELISGKPVDRRIDVFSLGIMLFHLSTAALPFTGRNPHEVLNRIADCDFARPSTVNPLVDDELEAIIVKALARDPDQRYPSAAALAADLESYLDSVGVRHQDDSEVVAYFHAPEDYIRELDQRVASVLLTRARAAATSGQNARAIRLLGRILERDMEHVEARQMLESMRRRGRTLRYALGALGTMCIGGLFTAAMFLWGGAQRGGEESSVDADLDPTEDAIPAVPPSRVIIPTRTSDPTRPTDDPETTRGAGDGATVAAADTGRSPSASGTERDGTSPPSAGPADKRILAPPIRAGATCTVEVTGPPVAQLTHHNLQVGGKSIAYDPAKRGYIVTMMTERSRATLAGKRWEGATTLERSRCATESAILAARAKPAKIIFRDLPAGVTAADVAIRCLEGCSEQGFADRWATKVPYGNDRTTVRLLLTAANEGTTYRVEREFRLYPGPNEHDARLKPILSPKN